MIRIVALALLSFMVSAPVLVDDDFTGAVCADGKFYSEGCGTEGEALTTGDEYFVDSNNGNDAATGRSHASAWASISKVNSSVTASGSRVYFLTNTITDGDLGADWGGATDDWAEIGTYCWDGSTERKWTAEGTGCLARARLDATTSGSHNVSGQYTRFDTIWLKKDKHPGDNSRISILQSDADDVLFTNGIIEGFGSRAETIQGRNDGKRLFGFNSSNQVRNNVTNSTIRWSSWNAINTSRISRYTGNTLLENFHMGFSIGPTAEDQDMHILIADNVCIESMNEDCVQSNRYFDGGTGDRDARKIIVHGNDLWGKASNDTPEDGIDFKAGMLWIMEQNYVHGWSQTGFNIGSGSGNLTSDMLVRFNICYDNGACNTHTSPNMVDFLYAHNTAVGNNRDGNPSTYDALCSDSASRQPCPEMGIMGGESYYTNNLTGNSNNVELQIQHSNTNRRGRWHFYRLTGSPRYAVWNSSQDEGFIYDSLAELNSALQNTWERDPLEANSEEISNPFVDVPEDPTGDKAQYDFNLRQGGVVPASSIDAAEGVSVATNTAASPSTSLTVTAGESCFFADYWSDEDPDGLGTWADYLTDAGLQPDFIKIGSGAFVQIASTDCGDGGSDNTVTLAVARTWTAGDEIYYTSSSGQVWDDMGACQTEGGFC